MPAAGQTDDGRIDVIGVQGPIDALTARFVERAIGVAVDDGVQAVVLRIDSPGAVDEESAQRLLDIVEAPPLPLVVWVGDSPAEALGAAARLLESAAVPTASPQSEIGWSEIEVIGGDAGSGGVFAGDSTTVTLEDDRFATVQAAVGQIVVWLDGQEVPYDGGSSVLDTAEEVTDDDGETRLQQTVTVRFVGPSVFTRTAHAALNPATLVFLISAGLAVAAFEYYALGPGVAAATALLPLLVGAYGLAHLPLSWWAVPLLVLGLFLMVVDYQAGAFGPWSIAGALLLAVGGRYFVDGAPVLEVSWVSAVLSAAATALFFAVAMPVVARTRFSTGTFGRTHLIGAPGVVVEGFVEGAGVVEVDGARWRATGHRESTFAEGVSVEVAAVQGLWLEVEVPEEG